MNLSHLLFENARKFPDVYAVKSEYGDLTYLELETQVNKLSNALLERKLKYRDKVAVFMPNTLEFVISYFAIQRIGAIVVPINVESTRPDIEYIIRDANASAIIVHNLVYDTLRELNADIIKIKTGKGNLNWESFLEITYDISSDYIAPTLTENDLATLLYTRDSTNEPKKVLVNYRSIYAVSHMLGAKMEITSKSRILIMQSANHEASFHLFLIANMLAGATLVLRTHFRPLLLIEAVENEKTTHFYGTPEAYLLTARKLQNKEADFTSMRWWIYHDLPIKQDEIKFIKRRFKTNMFISINLLTNDDPEDF